MIDNQVFSHEVAPFMDPVSQFYCQSLSGLSNIQVKTDYPHRLINVAVEQGWHLDMIKWLFEQHGVLDREAMEETCSKGNLLALQ